MVKLNCLSWDKEQLAFKFDHSTTYLRPPGYLFLYWSELRGSWFAYTNIMVSNKATFKSAIDKSEYNLYRYYLTFKHRFDDNDTRFDKLLHQLESIKLYV